MERKTNVSQIPTNWNPKVSTADNYEYGFSASLILRTIRDRPANEDRLRGMA